MAKAKPESELVRISNEYGLTAPQRKGLECILSAKPTATQEQLAQEIGVRRETVNVWLHQRKFLDAMHDAAGILIQSEWPKVIQTGLKEAKDGDIQWAKWLGELAGYYQPKAELKHTGKVEQEHTGSIDIADWNKEEAREAIRLIRDIKAKRTRAANIN